MPQMFKTVKKLEKSIKVAMLRAAAVELDEEDDIDTQITLEMEERGLKYTLEMVEKEPLAKIYEDTIPEEAAEEPVEGEAPKKKKMPNKSVMVKRLVDKIVLKHVEHWLNNLPDELQDVLCETLELDIKKGSKERKGMLEEIRDSIVNLGAESLLTPLGTEVLREAAKQAGHKATKDHSKQQLLEALIFNELDAPEKKEKKEKPVASKTKPKIAKGISKVDLQTHFYSPELTKWCEENNIKSNGAKKELIARILAFFEGDETVMKGYKKPAKKRSAAKAKGEPAEKKAKEDAEEGEAKKPKKEAKKKEEKKEEEPTRTSPRKKAATKKRTDEEDAEEKKEEPKKEAEKEKEKKEEEPKKEAAKGKKQTAAEKKEEAAAAKKEKEEAAAAAKEAKEAEKKEKEAEKEEPAAKKGKGSKAK